MSSNPHPVSTGWINNAQPVFVIILPHSLEKDLLTHLCVNTDMNHSTWCHVEFLSQLPFVVFLTTDWGGSRSTMQILRGQEHIFLFIFITACSSAGLIGDSFPGPGPISKGGTPFSPHSQSYSPIRIPFWLIH